MALLLALAGLFATPTLALAHASFVRSDPPDICGPLAVPQVPAKDPRCETGLVLTAAPTTVRIGFSEPVQLLGTGIRVLSPSAKRVDQPPANADGAETAIGISAPEEGTYVVEWQVMSSDTHPARGQFAFSVGHPSAPPVNALGVNVGEVTPVGLALQALAHWLHFAGYALAFGTLGFAWLIGMADRGLWRLTNAGIVLLILAEPLALLGQTGSLGLDQMLDGDTMGDALASPFGRLLGFRLAAALLLWVVMGSVQHTPALVAEGALRVQPRLAAGAAGGLAVALAFVDGLGQHAASFQPMWLGLAIHALHLMAMALWLGSLAGALATWQRTLNPRRIAAVAGGSLAVVGITGLAMGFVHILVPSDLLTTTYGRVLAAKQVFVIVAMAAAAVALRRRQKRNWWLGEAAALSCLIAVAGLLVSLPPPR